MRSLVLSVAVVASACDNGEEPVEADVFNTGSAPNAVVATTCGGDTFLLVPASQGAAVDVISADNGSTREIGLGQGSTPWGVSLLGDDVVGEGGDRLAVVTGFGTHSLFLIDPCSASTVDAVDVSSRPERVSVAGVRLRNDIDGVGRGGDSISEMPLMKPEAVVVDDVGGIWATFTNLLEVADSSGPMEAGAGVLARFVVDTSTGPPRLAYDRHVELRCQNPQGLATDGALVVVTCTGTFQIGDAGFEARTAGGVALYDADFVEVAHREDVGRSYGTPVIVDGHVVVGDVLGGVVYSYNVADLGEFDTQDLGDDNESIFKVLVIDGEVAALRFLKGDIVFDPFRTGRTRAIGDARQPPRGLIDLAVDDNGDGWAVFSLSAELVKVALK